MKRALAVAAIGTGLLAGAAGVSGLRAPVTPALVPITPEWSETAWPFPLDQWGIGKAFVCPPEHCGTRVALTVRPKIGFCNCSTGVADDAELERVADTELITQSVRAQAAGRPVKVGWMHGLSRRYQTAEGDRAGLISIAFNDECDAVVALATTGRADPAALEPAVLAFLDTRPTVLWIKQELGLEFVRRDW